MTQSIQDWRDAYDALYFAASACLDELPAQERERHSALVTSIGRRVYELENARAYTLGAAALDERARLYEQAVSAIADGPRREAHLLLHAGDERGYTKTTDEVKGCVDTVSRIFGVPRHAVVDDVNSHYTRKFGGDD